MKKIRNYAVIAVLMVACIFFAGCDLLKLFGGSDYAQFEIEYSKGLQFLVGEDWYDEQLKGKAEKKDGAIEDVTDRMEIDTSGYKKDVPGKYKIYVEFEDIRLNYEVEVVDKISETANIQARLNKIKAASFAEVNNTLSFEASVDTEVGDLGVVNEMLIYEEVDDNINAQITWTLNGDAFESEELMVFSFNGSREDGVASAVPGNLMLQQFGEGVVFTQSENQGVSLETFCSDIEDMASDESFASIIEFDPKMDIEYILSVKEGSFSGELTLENDEYTLTNTDNDYVVKYKNGKFTQIDDIYVTFPKSNTTEMTEIESIHSKIAPVVEENFARGEDGVLEISLNSVSYVTVESECIDVEQTMIIQIENDIYSIYNLFEIESECVELWYYGTLESGIVILESDGEFIPLPGNIMDFEEVLLGFESSIREGDEFFEIGILPSIVLGLEYGQFTGVIMIYDYEGNLYGMFQQEVYGVFCELLYEVESNTIITINDAFVEFSQTIETPIEIPELETA